MARIATTAIQRRAYGIFEHSDMSIVLDLSHSAGSHPAICHTRHGRRRPIRPIRPNSAAQSRAGHGHGSGHGSSGML